MLKGLVKSSRSFRRFYADKTISRATLLSLVELARFCPSARNQQGLKFKISCLPDTNDRIFPALTWAAALKDWGGPTEGERPAAYIIVLGDNTISRELAVDSGIAAQTILLGAREKRLGGCILANIDRRRLEEGLNLPKHLAVLFVIAIGKPRENVKIAPVGCDGRTTYYRDNKGTHFVPKRKLKDILV